MTAFLLLAAAPVVADDLADAKREVERANRAWVDAERAVDRAEADVRRVRSERQEAYNRTRELPHAMAVESERARDAANKLGQIERDMRALASNLAEIQGHEQTILRSLDAVEARLDAARRYISDSEEAARMAVYATPEYIEVRTRTDAVRAEMEAAIAQATARLEQTRVYADLQARYADAERRLSFTRDAWPYDRRRIAEAEADLAAAQSAIQSLRQQFLKDDPGVSEAETRYGQHKALLIETERRLMGDMLARNPDYSRAQADLQEAERTRSRIQSDLNAVRADVGRVRSQLRDAEGAAAHWSSIMRASQEMAFRIDTDLRRAEDSLRYADDAVRRAERDLRDAERRRDEARRRLDQARAREEEAARRTRKSPDPPRVKSN